MCAILFFCSCFFFFKQKTAYEMRISDWSSDVCSSDLVEVFAEQALAHHLAQVAMSRRDDAHVGADRRAAANGGVLALLQHPQQAGLRLQRHVADLVEEQRAAGGLLEAARGTPGGAGEGALLVAELPPFGKRARATEERRG